MWISDVPCRPREWSSLKMSKIMNKEKKKSHIFAITLWQGIYKSPVDELTLYEHGKKTKVYGHALLFSFFIYKRMFFIYLLIVCLFLSVLCLCCVSLSQLTFLSCLFCQPNAYLDFCLNKKERKTMWNDMERISNVQILVEFLSEPKTGERNKSARGRIHSLFRFILTVFTVQQPPAMYSIYEE